MSKQLSEEDIKSMFKTKPSVFGSFMTLVFLVWFMGLVGTTILVLTKLMILAWGWLW